MSGSWSLPDRHASATATRALEPCPEIVLPHGRVAGERKGPAGRELGQLRLYDPHAVAVQRFADLLGQVLVECHPVRLGPLKGILADLGQDRLHRPLHNVRGKIRDRCQRRDDVIDVVGDQRADDDGLQVLGHHDFGSDHLRLAHRRHDLMDCHQRPVDVQSGPPFLNAVPVHECDARVRRRNNDEDGEDLQDCLKNLPDPSERRIHLSPPVPFGNAHGGAHVQLRWHVQASRRDLATNPIASKLVYFRRSRSVGYHGYSVAVEMDRPIERFGRHAIARAGVDPQHRLARLQGIVPVGDRQTARFCARVDEHAAAAAAVVPGDDGIHVGFFEVAARKADPVAILHVLGEQFLGEARRRRLAVDRHQAVRVVNGVPALRRGRPSHFQLRAAADQMDERRGIVGCAKRVLVEAEGERVLVVRHGVELSADIEDVAAVEQPSHAAGAGFVLGGLRHHQGLEHLTIWRVGAVPQFDIENSRSVPPAASPHTCAN